MVVGTGAEAAEYHGLVAAPLVGLIWLGGGGRVVVVSGGLVVDVAVKWVVVVVVLVVVTVSDMLAVALTVLAKMRLLCRMEGN